MTGLTGRQELIVGYVERIRTGVTVDQIWDHLVRHYSAPSNKRLLRQAIARLQRRGLIYRDLEVPESGLWLPGSAGADV